VPDPDPHHFDGDKDGIGCESERSLPSEGPLSSARAVRGAGRLPKAERFRGSRPLGQATPGARPRLVALSATALSVVPSPN
jgi:hypothetical protein